MPKAKSTSKQTALFEIRLKHTANDVIVLKGLDHTAADAFLSGGIVLSVTEPIAVRKLSLRLYGTVMLKYIDAKGNVSRPPRFERKVYEYTWDLTEFARHLAAASGAAATAQGSSGLSSAAGAASPMAGALLQTGQAAPGLLSKTASLKGSTTSLKSLGMSLRLMSLTSLAHLNLAHGSQNNSSANLAAKSSILLVPANYEVPFSAVLPGNMPESVEGLPGASVVYKLEATLDRGKFHNPMVCKKHIRVVRTLSEDSAELSETMAVDNTWPKKVEYSLSVPTKAIAIGLGTPVSMMLVPLLKGLQLGAITMTLVEMYLYSSYQPSPLIQERVVCEKVIPQPDENDANFQMDKWELSSFLKIPANLSKCTQDCEILTHIKVRHKVKFVIGLRNPDGHVSELRATLPVQLFISPFVGIRATYEDDVFEDQEEDLFSDGEPVQELRDLRSNSEMLFTGLVAPPIYEQHVYDRLWLEISPLDSPASSGTQTPRSLYSRGDVLQFLMSAIDTARLLENLRQLSIQRESGDLRSARAPGTPDGEFRSAMLGRSESLVRGASEPPTGPGAGRSGPAQFNLDGDDDYFTRRHVMQLPTFTPQHILRSLLDAQLGTMSKVPSYVEAMRNNVEQTLSPTYKPPLPGSLVDLVLANRRYEEAKTPSGLASRSRLFILRGLSTTNLRLRNSSNGLLPAVSRNVSINNLAALGRRSPGGVTFSMGN